MQINGKRNNFTGSAYISHSQIHRTNDGTPNVKGSVEKTDRGRNRGRTTRCFGSVKSRYFYLIDGTNYKCRRSIWFRRHLFVIMSPMHMRIQASSGIWHVCDMYMTCMRHRFPARFDTSVIGDSISDDGRRTLTWRVFERNMRLDDLVRNVRHASEYSGQTGNRDWKMSQRMSALAHQHPFILLCSRLV
jgi:hypothetical protein